MKMMPETLDIFSILNNILSKITDKFIKLEKNTTLKWNLWMIIIYENTYEIIKRTMFKRIVYAKIIYR